MYPDVECPYCATEQDIDHDDGYGYSESETHQQACINPECRKIFVYTTSIVYHYDVDQADCLNGGEHEWKPTKTHPREWFEMYCTMCDEHRKPTEDERRMYL